MIPRLEAEERLARIVDGSVAAGTADKDLRRDLVNRLERATGATRRRAPKANAGALAAMGIGVKASTAAAAEVASNV